MSAKSIMMRIGLPAILIAVVQPGNYFVLITLRWDENNPDSLSGQSECNWNSGDQPLEISFP